ncbi:MAG: aconitate hydratase, partial [Acidimicrobiia bacterium]
REDMVHLCSPETATASALTGVITDPRDLDIEHPKVTDPEKPIINVDMLLPPLPVEEARRVELMKGPNIASLPEFDPLPEALQIPVLLKVGDDISTDEIMPAGARVLPFRSNIAKISEFSFDLIDETYPDRAREAGGHIVVGGGNYGQGSSREHAAVAPRFLGLRAVIAKGFARIHWQNLVNFGVVPLTFVDADDYDRVEQGDALVLDGLREAVPAGRPLTVQNVTKGTTFQAGHDLSGRQVEVLLAGGLFNWMRERLAS